MRFTEESKKQVAQILQALSSEQYLNGDIGTNEATALNYVSLSILIGFSDTGLKAFATADSSKTINVSPMAVAELVSTWWEDVRIVESFPFLIDLREAVKGDAELFDSAVNWHLVLNAYINTARELVEF